MSKIPAARPMSLRDKISGPHAVPIARLVERGEAASLRIQKDFDGFLQQRVAELEELLDTLDGDTASDEVRRNVFTIVLDIRGSSALAGKPLVGTICSTFETLLQQRDPADPRMKAAIASHTAALNLVMAKGALDEESSRLLTGELSRAVDCLPLKKQDFPAI